MAKTMFVESPILTPVRLWWSVSASAFGANHCHQLHTGQKSASGSWTSRTSEFGDILSEGVPPVLAKQSKSFSLVDPALQLEWLLEERTMQRSDLQRRRLTAALE